MIAALATLTFLVALWMLVVVGAVVIETSGGKILAALKGHIQTPTAVTRSIPVRHPRHQQLRAVRVSARQRAAA